MRVGRRIKERRLERGLTLRALAERSGVSAAMISEVERGAKSPTITVLSAIAEALETPLSHVVDVGAAPAVIIHTKAGEEHPLVEPTGVRREHLGPVVRESTVEFVRLTVPAGVTSGIFAPHPRGSIERLYLDAGTVEVHLEEEAVRMERGDSLCFAADRRHWYHNPGKRDAVIYLVVDPGAGARAGSLHAPNGR